MILLEGKLKVKIINGREGDFAVGKLATDIGKFAIRNQLLDQFDEGEYDVKAAISELKLRSYPSLTNGIVVTEIEAVISQLDVVEAFVKPVEEEGIEPDASVAETDQVDPDKVTKPVERKGKIVLKAKPKKQSTQYQEDEALFGLLWPLGESVQLDKTLPRATIIKQSTRLKELAYVFDGKTQTWSKSV